MRRTFIVIALLAIALLSGCASLRLAGLRAELERAETRWMDAGFEAYAYTLRWVCFCPSQEVRVKVERGVVVSVETLPDLGAPFDPDRYGPIEDLFAFVRDAIDQRAFSIAATYDPGTGVPLSASVDYLQYAVDDETGFVLRDFESIVGDEVAWEMEGGRD